MLLINSLRLKAKRYFFALPEGKPNRNNFI